MFVVRRHAGVEGFHAVVNGFGRHLACSFTQPSTDNLTLFVQIFEQNYHLGNEREALYYLRQSIREAQGIRADFIALDALVSIAGLRAQHGETKPALELLEMIIHHPKADLESVRSAEKLLAQLGGLPAGAVSAAQIRGRELVLAEVIASVLENAKA